MHSRFADFLANKFRIDAHYFLKGGFWLSIAQIITVGFGIVSTALFAHFLSEQDYGLYRYLISISVILASFSLTGLGQSVLQATAQKFLNFYRETLGINFLFSLSITASALIGTTYYWLNGNSTLAIGCLMVGAFQPLITTFQNTQHYLQGAQQYRQSTTLHTIRIIITTTLSVGVLFLTKDILVLFLFYLLGLLLANVYGHIRYSPKGKVPTPSGNLQRYISYAKHTSFRSAIGNVAQRADAIIIFTQLGAAELALYSIATVVPEQIKGSVKNLASLLLPKYAKHSDQTQILKSAPKRATQLFVILVIITVLFIIAVPSVYNIIFPKYTEAIFLSQVLALSFPAMIAIIPVSALQSKMEEKKLYRIQIIESILLVTLTTLLTIYLGVIGAIIAKIATRYFTLGYNFYLLYRH